MASKQRIAVIGAGGCAREVAWTLREAARAGGELELAGYVISDRSQSVQHDTSTPLFDFDDFRKGNAPDGFVLGVGAPALRAKLFEEARSRFPDATWPAIVHPSVQCHFASVSIGVGVVLCAGAIVTVNVRLDEHVLIHYGSLISHEVSIGRFTNINPGCAIAGGVAIEEEVAVGIGTRIIQNVRVGARAVIGAGAVVIRDVAAGTTVVGVPARALR